MPSLLDATLVFPLRSEVLLLIWEGQPRRACQAHWGMDFTQRLCHLWRMSHISSGEPNPRRWVWPETSDGFQLPPTPLTNPHYNAAVHPICRQPILSGGSRFLQESGVHDRMPVILDPDGYDLWLDPGMQDVSEASELLKPFDARMMRCFPISTRINHVANDDEECSAPMEVAETQSRLFS